MLYLDLHFLDQFFPEVLKIAYKGLRLEAETPEEIIIIQDMGTAGPEWQWWK